MKIININFINKNNEYFDEKIFINLKFIKFYVFIMLNYETKI
jgi:hypothetical protein